MRRRSLHTLRRADAGERLRCRCVGGEPWRRLHLDVASVELLCAVAILAEQLSVRSSRLAPAANRCCAVGIARLRHGFCHLVLHLLETMRGKLWIRFAPFLWKRHVSTCRTSSISPSSSCSAIQPWLFVGLGNPGEKYQSTRHNVGFDMIDAFAQSQGISLTTHHCKALFGEGMVHGVPVLLAKPQTYINLSGESAGPLAACYKLPLNRVLVAYDDTDLPCGVLRLQPKGGYRRHNGLKSVIYHFRKKREFGRLRIGIGRPPGQMDPKAFVLQKFNKTGRERIDSAIQEGVDILKMVVTNGLTEVARLSNVDQKYKHLISHDQQV